MTTFTFIGLVASLFGCVSLYLASPHQSLLAARWSTRPARIWGLTLLALGVLCLARGMQALTASFVFVTTMMLVFSVLPYIGALRNIRRKG